MATAVKVALGRETCRYYGVILLWLSPPCAAPHVTGKEDAVPCAYSGSGANCWYDGSFTDHRFLSSSCHAPHPACQPEPGEYPWQDTRVRAAPGSFWWCCLPRCHWCCYWGRQLVTIIRMRSASMTACCAAPLPTRSTTWLRWSQWPCLRCGRATGSIRCVLLSPPRLWPGSHPAAGARLTVVHKSITPHSF